MRFSLWEMWAVMGTLAKSVVGLLVVMSLASLGTAGEKWFALRRARAETARFLVEWRRRLERSGLAAAAADTARFPHSHLAHAIAAGTAVWQAGLEPDERREAYDRTIHRSLLAAEASMRRGLSVLATVGSTAPFVGLVGTVVGIVNAFQKLAASGQGGVGEVSAGIAEALVTTAFGIAVAIPAVWLFNHFTHETARVLADIECAAEELAVAAIAERAAPRRAAGEARRSSS